MGTKSKGYGMNTMYFKTIHYASIEDDAPEIEYLEPAARPSTMSDPISTTGSSSMSAKRTSSRVSVDPGVVYGVRPFAIMDENDKRQLYAWIEQGTFEMLSVGMAAGEITEQVTEWLQMYPLDSVPVAV